MRANAFDFGFGIGVASLRDPVANVEDSCLRCRTWKCGLKRARICVKGKFVHCFDQNKPADARSLPVAHAKDENRMMTAGTFHSAMTAMILGGFAWPADMVCGAEPGDDAGFAALQTDAKKAFREGVTPFLNTYCADCHGNKKRKGGVNFQSAISKPGDAASGKRWKQALATVKAHDMPPDDADKQPTDEERQKFADWIGKAKYLSPKEPGPFVIRRLTKAEYGNTLHDFLGVDPAVAHDLPDEVFGEGYLNTLSPLQSEQYLGIANDVLDRILPANGATSEVQKRFFGNPPAPGTDARAAAKNVARSLARKAYRRPASEEEVDVLLGVFDLATKNKLAYPAALRLMLKAVLVSPQFLFITPAKDAEQGHAIVPLDDWQLASRLSYLLWATMPDAELSALADSGKLREPAVLRAQVKRLLADRRSRALFDGFGAQWLGLGDLKSKTFDTAKFPQMTKEMRAAMVDEARLFFESIVRENRSVVSFVDCDYTFLNGTLATLYGLEKTVTGPQMRKVKLTDANRGGILGMPGILAVTSFPNRTSAVKRGVWVLEQVLGEHVPPAPPNVPALEKQDKKKVANLTLRQRTELHRTNAVCANCHKILDPIGFGLENFDAIGRWRDKDDSGGAIDAAGELPGGKHFSTPKELKVIIGGRKDELARNLTEKLLAYALCRQLEGYDEIVVDHLMETLAKDGYRVQTLISEIVTSYPFTNHRIQEPIASSTTGK
jgi:mono/diheme cytochrome c family protein